jgi:hypothetical protein
MIKDQPIFRILSAAPDGKEIEAALEDGYRPNLCELATYLRREERPIPRTIRNHIAELLEAYPQRSTKLGRRAERKTLNEIRIERHVVILYENAKYALGEAWKEIKKARKNRINFDLNSIAQEWRVPRELLERMQKDSKTEEGIPSKYAKELVIENLHRRIKPQPNKKFTFSKAQLKRAITRHG